MQESIIMKFYAKLISIISLPKKSKDKIPISVLISGFY